MAHGRRRVYSRTSGRMISLCRAPAGAMAGPESPLPLRGSGKISIVPGIRFAHRPAMRRQPHSGLDAVVAPAPPAPLGRACANHGTRYFVIRVPGSAFCFSWFRVPGSWFRRFLSPGSRIPAPGYGLPATGYYLRTPGVPGGESNGSSAGEAWRRARLCCRSWRKQPPWLPSADGPCGPARAGWSGRRRGPV
jgi:hypothetical protein